MQCEYIFKKGISKGKACEKKALHFNMCTQHRPNASSEFSVILKKLKKICDDWSNLKTKEDEILIQISGVPFPIPKIVDTLDYNGQSIAIPQIILNKWILSNRIGKGGFGMVYECFTIQKPYDKCAVKVEPSFSKGLCMEMQFYNNYSFLDCIPRKIETGVYKTIKYAVLEKLNPFTFTFEKIPDILDCLKAFANIKRVHGDVKIGNIMQRICDNKIVLIDFGLSRKITDFEPNSKNISGTLIYMSVNAHKGILSYKNDLESLAFCILQMCNPLPWTDTKIQDIFKVLEMKESFIGDFFSKNNKILKTYAILQHDIVYNFISDIFSLKNNYPNYDKLKTYFMK